MHPSKMDVQVGRTRGMAEKNRRASKIPFVIFHGVDIHVTFLNRLAHSILYPNPMSEQSHVSKHCWDILLVVPPSLLSTSRMRHCSTFSLGRVSVRLNAPTVERPSGTKTSWSSTCVSTAGTPTLFPATFAARASRVTRPWRTICWCTRKTAPTLVSYARIPLRGWTCSKTTSGCML